MELVIDKLKSILDLKKQKFDEKESFFYVLGRTYDEDLISRVISYILGKDKELIKKLIKKYAEDQCDEAFPVDVLAESEVNVCPEKMMGIGRADIFIEIVQKNQVVATITIENKIWSWEHSHQTKTYYDWVTRQPRYKESFNAFYFLRPEFNDSKAECEKYVNITYSVMCDMIELNDYIAKDFKNHSNLFFKEKNMSLTEDQLFFIENYNNIQNALSETLDIYKTMQKNLIKEIKEKFSEDLEIKFEEKADGIGIGSFRLYKEKWYKEDEYYFYVEIRFVSGKLSNIYYQKTAKDYQNKKDKKIDSNVIRFVKEERTSDFGHYHVFDQEEHSSLKDWTSKEWENEFVLKAAEKLKEYIIDMDELFVKFSEFND